MIINSVLAKAFYLTLIGIPVTLAVIAFALVMFGHETAIVITLLALWGLMATAAPVGWWAWVPETFPNDAESGGGLMVAVIQLSIAIGSTLGGLLFDTSGYQTTFIASAAILLLSALFTGLTSRTTPS